MIGQGSFTEDLVPKVWRHRMRQKRIDVGTPSGPGDCPAPPAEIPPQILTIKALSITISTSFAPKTMPIIRVLSLFIVIAGAMAAWASPAGAGARTNIGGIGVFTNDYLGDRKDRWRTGSFMRSQFFGPNWTGRLPSGGVVTEFRLRMEMIAPTRIWRAPEAGERPYVGLIAPGAFAHFRRGPVEYRLGGELAIVGPQTRVGDFMDRAHEVLGFKEPLGISGQIADAVRPTVMADVARPFHLSRGVLRPFASVVAGAETGVRVGFDVMAGGRATTTLFAREPVTGQMIGAARSGKYAGPVINFGADVMAVADSHFLPGGQGYEIEPLRYRLRAGVDGQIGGFDVFYGLTWLSPEYSTQTEGQIVGSIAMFLRF